MRYTLPLWVLLGLLLSACSGAPVTFSAQSTPDGSATLSAIVSATLSAVKTETPSPITVSLPSATPPQPTLPPTAAPVDIQPAGQDLTRTDAQGAVEVDITPTNLSSPGDTLDFEVALNTHSVDLSMDLAKLATLKTDTGLSTSATAWDGMAGGHHVSGNLSFPAQVNGKGFLDGAKVLTLVIRNVDAPERTFTWNLTP